MEERRTTTITYFRKGARVTLKVVLFLLLFLILLFLLILTPPVQRFLTGRVEHYLSNKLHTKVAIKSISFGLSGNISLSDVYIEDKTKGHPRSGRQYQSPPELPQTFFK
jgi:translocation and assembly module TamB